ncbi:MAG: LamG-like jellyroll fold domain-containing protein [bacterium]|nr:LamG-like jellyroll fold domain-containing protein [bacterium]MDZ4231981.1 LamG-like jellyroll fold domain-containing protein [Candidatus Pacearchaeota archaeon]
MRRAFTLIELLVVIAVIGLLASIVLVNLQGVRERGRMAAGKQFSSHLQSTLGSEAVGIWRFNEGSGATAYDNAGYGNNGSLTNGPAWKTAVECGLDLGACLSFDGADDYVALGDILGFEGFAPYTVSVWINTTTFDGTWRRIVSKHGVVGTREGWLLWIHLGSTRELGFERFVGGVNNGSTFFQSNAMPSGEWAHVVGTFDGSKSRLYLNGSLVATPGTATLGLIDTSVPLAIGRDGGGGSYFGGMADDVAIYASALSTTQVQQLYAEGKDSHLAEQ